MAGNPFAAVDDKQDLLATGGLRSDAANWRDEPLEKTQRTAETNDAPPLQPAGYPPPSTGASLTPQFASPTPPPPAPGASGAWGGGIQAGMDDPPPPYSAAAYAGAPPPYGVPYGAGAFGAPVPPSGYQQGAAWTTTGPSDRLSYQPFEQAHAAGPQQKMRCRGLGEQWTLFIVSWILWPGWYVASIWYCVSPKQQAEPRHKVPFILNCTMSVVFTIVWVALVSRRAGWRWYNDSYNECIPDTLTGACL